LAGNYLYTLVFKETTNNDLGTGKAKTERVDKNISKEKSVEINKLFKQGGKIDDLIEKEIKGLKIKSQEIIGFTQQEVEKAKESIKIEAQNESQMTTLSTSANGAYDNYYNRDSSTGAFTIQALADKKQSYIQRKGNITGSTKNKESYEKFRGYIDSYVSYTQQASDAGQQYKGISTWTKGVSTFINLGTTAVMLYGPPGWAAASAKLGASAAAARLSALTYDAYGNYANLGYTQKASEQLRNAHQLLRWDSGAWDNVSLSVVSGY
jgi:hypothetical protein